MRAAWLLSVTVAGCAYANAPANPDSSGGGDGNQGGDEHQSGDMHALTLTLAGGGGGVVGSTPAGINCGADCTETYAAGTTVTLIANPGVGSVFGGWAGACSGMSATCIVTISAATNVTATFHPASCTSGMYDNFDLANTSTISGWTERLGDWQIENMAARQDQLQGVYSHYMTRDVSSQTDGCASLQAKFNTTATGNSVQSVGVVLRWTNANNYVVGLVQDNTGSGTFNTTYIYQYPGGNDIGGGGTSGAYGTSPRIKLCITGTNVVLSVDAGNDGTYEATKSGTTSLTGAGLAGIMTHTFSAQPTADDFCVGQ